MSSNKKKREDTKAFNDKRNRMTTGIGAFLQADDWATTESNSSQDDPGYERVISFKGVNFKLL